MDINELAKEINHAAKNYRFGSLQEIRKQIKGLARKPSNNIFTSASISDDGWAFHIGGRTEMQFNIGFENDGLRYGLAFSLEPSQSLPDVTILYPKILRLNSLYRERPELFIGFKLWYWSGERSETLPMQEIPTEWIHPHCFIFFGELMDDVDIDVDQILICFDRMLPIYLEVESTNTSANEQIVQGELANRFQFSAAQRRLPSSRSFTSIERETNIDIRHSIIQQTMYEKLVLAHGNDNVSLEQPFSGNKIDIVVRDNNSFLFYEIKTGNSAKSCIRQAIGQLLEYAFYPGRINASKIVVVGEHDIDLQSMNYINYLNSSFNLPINYEKIDI